MERPVIDDSMLASASEKADFERGLTYFPRFTLLMISILSIIFVWEATSGALESSDTILRAGALTTVSFLAGDYWRLISCMFLHADLGHLIANSLGIYAFGLALEHAYGPFRIALCYFASGLLGSLLILLTATNPTIGASGAVFGMAGLLTMFCYRHGKNLELHSDHLAAIIFAWAAYSLLVGAADPRIANLGHLGGFLGGILVSPLLPLPIQLRQGKQSS